MRTWIASLSLVLAAAFAANAFGQCCNKKPAETKDTTAKTCCQTGDKTTAAADQCAGQKLADAEMPLITYRVGDKTTQCPKQAREMAGDDESKITYLVADKTYTDKAEADQAYEKVLEDHLATLTSVRYAVGKECVSCPMTAKSMARKNHEKVEYQVGTFKFTSQDDATRVAQGARKAADGVRLQCMRDGKLQDCDPATCMKKVSADGKQATGNATCSKDESKGCPAKCTGTGDCEWVIGDLHTKCQTTAQIALTRARILAALDVVEKSRGS
ncbi:MAG: hypothetical protein PVJ57_18910 [Phycisphaerae bacterium]